MIFNSTKSEFLSIGSMDKVRLEKTELMVYKIGLSGVPLQRLTDDEAAAVTKRCLDKGIIFFDTAIEYSNSEEHLTNH